MVEQTLRRFVQRAQRRFVHAGIAQDEAAIDAELLAMHALDWDRASLVTRWREPAPEGFAERYADLTARREAREPTAYIVGAREFYGRPFEVTPACLIPRPETEELVSAALEIAARFNASPRIVDVGTGSGCIAVTLALEDPRAWIVAIDVSADALALARPNALRLGATRVTFVRGSLIEAIAPSGPSKADGIDIIVSNPPYVPLGDRETLQPEVRDFEPARALFAGDDGLAVIRALVEQAAVVLRSGGWLQFELGAGQATQVDALIDPRAWALRATRPDLQGTP
ncbi:MAG: peptide chain release factor N(5)-glutamine methyltransferase, partial [Vicinamibacteraceae bacterium]